MDISAAPKGFSCPPSLPKNLELDKICPSVTPDGLRELEIKTRQAKEDAHRSAVTFWMKKVLDCLSEGRMLFDIESFEDVNTDFGVFKFNVMHMKVIQDELNRRGFKTELHTESGKPSVLEVTVPRVG